MDARLFDEIALPVKYAHLSIILSSAKQLMNAAFLSSTAFEIYRVQGRVPFYDVEEFVHSSMVIDLLKRFSIHIPEDEKNTMEDVMLDNSIQAKLSSMVHNAIIKTWSGV